MTRDPGLESWIVDASPLILLGNIGQVARLEALAPRIKVPEAVLEEEAAGVDLDRQGGVTLAWAKVHTVPNIQVPQSIAGWDLGAGESQVVAQCLAGARRAVLDDAQARAAARVHGVRLIGTLGVILRARRANLIAAARPVIEQLRERGAYLDDDLAEQALRNVGE